VAVVVVELKAADTPVVVVVQAVAVELQWYVPRLLHLVLAANSNPQGVMAGMDLIQ
jgi:hypothetical protein